MASPLRQGPDVHGERSLVFSNDTAVSRTSNAFEGALDGLDFSMEPFGVDSWSWPANDWVDPEIHEAGMAVEG